MKQERGERAKSVKEEIREKVKCREKKKKKTHFDVFIINSPLITTVSFHSGH